MITSVTFDDTIPYRIDRRDALFRAADGWTITEEQPGRVRLVCGDVDIVVQSMPYTLTQTPRVGELPETVLSEIATKAEQAMACVSSKKKHGR